MKPFQKSQIPALYNAETPPCVSIYVPLTSISAAHHNSENFLEIVNEMTLLARNEVALKYSASQADRLTIKTTELPVQEILRDCKGDTLCIFSSPEFNGYMVIPGIFPKAYRVGDSFYLKPVSDCMLDQISIFGQLLFGHHYFPFQTQNFGVVSS